MKSRSRRSNSVFLFVFTFVVFAFIPVAYANPSVKGSYPSKPLIKNLHETALAKAKALKVAEQKTPAPPITKCPPQCDELIEKARKFGPVRVIVGLNIPNLPDPSRAPAKSRAEVDSKRMEAIAQAQERLLATMARHNIKHVLKFKIIPGIAMSVDEMALRALIANPEVEKIYEEIWFRPALSQSVPLVAADQSWASGITGAGYVIAVLDTGVDTNHSFLSGRIESEACYSASGTATNPYDGTQYTITSLCPDGSTVQIGPGAGIHCSGVGGCSHGTHVAGIALGRGASFSGVARDSRLMAIQVFSRIDGTFCSPYPSPCLQSSIGSMFNALEHVYLSRGGMNLGTVNMSLGVGRFTDYCDADAGLSDIKTIVDNLRAAGIATVVASGNDGWTDATRAPACISSAISVGSTTKSDTVSSFSNSAPFLSLLAPGGDGSAGSGDIYSSVPGGGFAYSAGTSMAAPHVAGAFTLLKSQSPTATVSDLLSVLKTMGVQITDNRDGIDRRIPRIHLTGTPWLARFGGDSNGGADRVDEVTAATVDNAGNIVVTGYSTEAESCIGEFCVIDYATIKYSPTGERLWIARYGNGFRSFPTGIVSDASNNIYVTGYSCGQMECYSTDYLTVKYDANGNQVWTRSYNNGGPDYATAIALDDSGNVYVTGQSCNFNGACAGYDIATIKYDSDSNIGWVARYNNGYMNGPDSLATDISGNIYVTGFSCFTSQCADQYPEHNPITIKYDNAGNQVWVARFTNQNFGRTSSLAVDAAGNVIIAGWSGNNNATYFPSELIVKYGPNGNITWWRSNGDREGRINDIAVDGFDNVLAVGSANDADSQYLYMTQKYTPNGILAWESTIAEGADGEPTDMVLAANGSAYVTGFITEPQQDLYETYLVTVKYDANGNELWKRLQYTGGEALSDVAIANLHASGLYVAGSVGGVYVPAALDYVTIRYAP